MNNNTNASSLLWVITPRLFWLKTWTGAFHTAAAPWTVFSAIDSYLNANANRSVNEGWVYHSISIYCLVFIINYGYSLSKYSNKTHLTFRRPVEKTWSAHCTRRFKQQCRNPSDWRSPRFNAFVHWQHKGDSVTEKSLVLHNENEENSYSWSGPKY